MSRYKELAPLTPIGPVADVTPSVPSWHMSTIDFDLARRFPDDSSVVGDTAANLVSSIVKVPLFHVYPLVEYMVKCKAIGVSDGQYGRNASITFEGCRVLGALAFATKALVDAHASSQGRLFPVSFNDSLKGAIAGVDDAGIKEQLTTLQETWEERCRRTA